MKRCKSKDGYLFCLSSKLNKKYDVFNKDTREYITSFGDIRYSHYYDQIGLLPKSLNHLDEERRKLYYKRHGKSAKFQSAKWFSHNFLW